jgi:hypothetical protein
MNRPMMIEARSRDIVDEADHRSEPVVPAVLGQIGAGEQAERLPMPARSRSMIEPVMALRRPPSVDPGGACSG